MVLARLHRGWNEDWVFICGEAFETIRPLARAPALASAVLVAIMPCLRGLTYYIQTPLEWRVDAKGEEEGPHFFFSLNFIINCNIHLMHLSHIYKKRINSHQVHYIFIILQSHHVCVCVCSNWLKSRANKEVCYPTNNDNATTSFIKEREKMCI